MLLSREFRKLTRAFFLDPAGYLSGVFQRRTAAFWIFGLQIA